MKKPRKFSQRNLLYLVSIIGSGAGFTTQVLISGFWSTAFSNDVFYFSVNLAFYFLSLGIGSLICGYLKKPKLGTLFIVTLAQTLWCGISVSVLRLGIGFYNQRVWIPIVTVSVAGLLAGMVIPLTVRIGEKIKSLSISRLFFLDYCAAIVFTLLFTLVMLVPLGYSRTAMWTALFCALSLGILMLLAQEKSLKSLAALIVALVAPYAAHVGVMNLNAITPDVRGAKVLYKRQSQYQKIVLTESASASNSLYPGMPQHSLYLDGFLQFSSADEQLYHLCITNIPMAAASYNGRSVANALILGGGDGLAARNLLASPRVKKITMVELDASVIELAKTHPKIRMYNLDSLKNPRVEILNKDAFRWVGATTQKFDMILIDFPSPKNLTLARLFSAEFYRQVFKLLQPGGFIAIQAGPAFGIHDEAHISDVTASIKKTVRAIGFPAHVYMTQRDQDAFVLATNDIHFDMDAFSKKVGIQPGGDLSPICLYDPNWKENPVEVNTLNTLPLARYALEWYRVAGLTNFFRYEGYFGVFLPD